MADTQNQVPDQKQETAEKQKIPEDTRNEDEKIESWKVPSDDIRWEKLTDDGGLLKWTLKKGDGDAPENGAKVKCHYTGLLLENGKKFDSSKDRGDFFTFDLGQGRVIKGWDKGIATMVVGEQCVLRCREDYAYGKNGSPPNIPGGATLDFVVSLEEIMLFDPVDGCDDCIGQYTMTQGDYSEAVRTNSKVTFTVTGRSKTKKGEVFFEEKECTVTVPYDMEFDGKGYVEEYPHCRAFYKALTECSKGGHYQYRVLPDDRWSYPEEECTKRSIEAGVPIFYEIKVTDVDSPKQSWDMDSDEKEAAAVELKTKGNGFFKAKKLELAVKLYGDALDMLNEDNLSDEAKSLKVSLYSNKALILIKTEEWAEAQKSIDSGLELDKTSVKLIYRNAQCLDHRGDYEECCEVLKGLLALEEKNTAALRLMKVVKKKNKAYIRKKKALAAKFFK